MAYSDGRNALVEYVKAPGAKISPYFRALLEFEVCVSQIYQGLELLRSATGQDIFSRGDRSVGERLNLVYNDSKHMNEMIAGGKIPTDATSALWITNSGLGSSRCRSLTFDELRDTLLEMMQLADAIAAPVIIGQAPAGEAGPG